MESRRNEAKVWAAYFYIATTPAENIVIVAGPGGRKTTILDTEIRDEILDLIAHVTANATLVVVTHDLAVAERLKCRTLRLADGELSAA